MQRVSLPGIHVPASAWVKPGITVLSVTAIATIGFAGPASAAGPQPHPVMSKSTYQSIVSAIRVAGASNMSAHDLVNFDGFPVIPGTGQNATPDFGAGKDVVYVEAMPGTFPEGSTPDLSKVTFDFRQTQSDGTGTQDVDMACFNAPTSADDPYTPCINEGPLQLDQPFAIAFDAAHSTLPTGFLAPGDVTDTIGSDLPPIDFTSLNRASFAPRAVTPPPVGCLTVTDSPPLLFCNKAITIQIPGAWRPIGLDLTNKVSGKPLADTTFVLNQGATKLGTAKTNSSGHLTFPGVYQGGNFTVVQKTTPTGFAVLGAPVNVTVPAITKAADAGKEYDAHVKLAPIPPTAVDDSTSTAQDKAKVVTVLGNDTAVSAPLTVASVGAPSHGTAVANPDGTVTYTPAKGFSGTDTFTYAVHNALGGTDTATVTVTVVRTGVLGDRLAMTGQPSWVEGELGASSVVAGGLLLAAGRRRRRAN